MLQTWHYCKIIHVLQILKPVSIFVEKKKLSLNLTVFNYIATEVGRIHWPLSFLDADIFGQTGRI